MMKRLLFAILAAAIVCLVAPAVFAQSHTFHDPDHVQAGIFGEFYREGQSETNLAGVGARFSVHVVPLVQLEAEMSYDFNQVFTESFASGGGVTFQRTNMRRIDGLFGPKVQTNRGPVRLFLTAKGGATAFGFSTAPATIDTFFSSVSNLRLNDAIAEFYPGGGAEAFLGPIGLRFDVGDEMLFTNGVHHNLRVTFGPSIRF
jgi:hypothetical protein